MKQITTGIINGIIITRVVHHADCDVDGQLRLLDPRRRRERVAAGRSGCSRRCAGNDIPELPYCEKYRNCLTLRKSPNMIPKVLTFFSSFKTRQEHAAFSDVLGSF